MMRRGSSRDQHEADSATTQRPDIQGLRAIAVLLVMLNHAGIHGFSGGFVGVDVFFVISGFLITQQLVRQSQDGGKVPFARFYTARARRILPMAVLVLVVTALASRVLVNYVRAKQVDYDAIWAVFFAANVHFAHIGTNYFAQGQPPSPIQHYWSLSVEEQFYLVWPALLAIVLFLVPFRRRHWGTEHRRRRVLVVLAAIVIASIVWSIHDTRTDPTSAYFSTFARAWELGIGALVAVGYGELQRLSAWSRAVAGWAGLAGIAFACVKYSGATAFPGSAALLPVVGAALLLIGGLKPTPAGPDRLLGRQPLRYTGDISYSLYLWHWPLLAIWAAHVGHDLSVATNLGLLAVAFGLSALSYRFYENPLHRGGFLREAHSGMLLWPVAFAVILTYAAVDIQAINARLVPGPASISLTAAGGTQIAGHQGAVAAVRQSVHSGLSGARVPNALQLAPSPAQLPTDFYSMTACESYPPSTTTNRICHLGDVSAARTAVVFGDSHAQQMMPALLAFSRAAHYHLIPFVKPDCESQVWGGYLDTKDAKACRSWLSWAESRVHAIRPSLVIVDAEYLMATPQASYIRQGIRMTVTSLSASTTGPVVVLGDNPPGIADPTDCLLAPGATLAQCASSLSSSVQSLSSSVKSTVEQAGGRFVPTVQWFCWHGHCPLVVDDTITHVDAGHITPEYAAWLAKAVTSAIRNVAGLSKRAAPSPQPTTHGHGGVPSSQSAPSTSSSSRP